MSGHLNVMHLGLEEHTGLRRYFGWKRPNLDLQQNADFRRMVKTQYQIIKRFKYHTV